MSTRTLAGVVDWLKALAVDPREYPEARNAFRRVLDKLGRVDTGTAADVIEATKPPTLHGLPQDWPVVTDGGERQELLRLMGLEAEVA